MLTCAAKKNDIHNKIIILTATSGDTGKAALAGFADVPGTGIIVFYPKNGVSPVQEKQMITQRGNNTYVVGITGNFDDAQTGVKNMFGNRELAERMNEKGYQFSSANSINIGRLVPQIVYYVYAYGRLLADGVINRVIRLIMLFLPVTLAIYLLLIMQAEWEYLSESLFVLLMRIRFCMISSEAEHMTETEILY